MCRFLVFLIFLLPIAVCAQLQNPHDGKDSEGSVSKPQEFPAKSDPVPAQHTTTRVDFSELQAIKKPKAIYPAQAQRDEIQGQVWVQFEVSQKGEVQDVQIISGNPVLAKAAADAVRKWKFKPFVQNGKAIKVVTTVPFDFFFHEKVIEKGTSRDRTAIASKSTDETAATLPAASPESSTPSNADSAPQPVAVGAEVSKGMLVRAVAPVYPADARRRGVQGDVILQAVIGKDGRITGIVPLSGPAELVSAAVGAVQQWRYKPYMLNGEPVEVKTHITVHFRLSR